MDKFLKFFLLTFLLFSDFIAFAQPGDDDGGGLEDDDIPAAPINAKLVWLALVGILFAWYMYKQRRIATR